MILKKFKVYHYFWLVSIIILIIGICRYNITNTLDINIHDTYFVISDFHVAIILCITYFIYGLGYWFVQEKFKKPLVKILTILHSVFLIGSFLVYWIVVVYCQLFVPNNFPLSDNYQTINITLVFCSILCIIALPIYIINLTIAAFR